MGGVHMQALGYSVCHVYQTATERHRETEREVIPDAHTQVQTSPEGLVSVIDALMGVGGRGWRWTEGGRVQTWTSKGPAGRLSTNALSSDTRGWHR